MKAVPGFVVKPDPGATGFAFELKGGAVAVIMVSVIPEENSTNCKILARAWKAEKKTKKRSVNGRGVAYLLPDRWRVVVDGLSDSVKLQNEITDVVRKVYDELVAHIAAMDAVTVPTELLTPGEQV